jgi:hypothetical protein
MQGNVCEILVFRDAGVEHVLPPGQWSIATPLLPPTAER